MADQVIDGIRVPDDEGLIIIPDGYADPIITREHFAQKGENIVTCNMVLEDPLKKMGQEVACPTCGQKFKVVNMKDAEMINKIRDSQKK
jgi:hypothetical protein